MRISTALVIMCLLFSGAMVSLGFYAASYSEQAQRAAIQSQWDAEATTLIENIDRGIYSQTANWAAFVNTIEVQRCVRQSNEHFDRLADRVQYIEDQDHAWRAAGPGETTALMEGIQSEALSMEMTGLMTRLNEAYGNRLIGEVFVTNRYGVVAAMTGRTSDYRQDDEDWWQIAKRDGVYVGQLAWDESAGALSLPLCVRIDDELGNFSGVLKAVSDVREIVGLLEAYAANHPSVRLALLASDGHPIHAVGSGDMPLGDSSSLRSEADDNVEPARTPSLGTDPASRAEIVSVAAKSHGCRSFPGLGWSIVIENDADLVFRSARALRRTILVATLCLLVVALATGGALGWCITRRLNRLITATVELGRGNHEAPVPIRGRDEVAKLAQVFVDMRDRLSESFAEKDAKARRLEEAKEELEREAVQRRRSEDALRQRSATLNETLKELGCLYFVSRIIDAPDATLKSVLQGALDAISGAWQYPDDVCARVMLEGQAFQTPNYQSTEWKQDEAILAAGEEAGRIEICYLTEKPDADEGPFLKQERQLLRALAERLGGFAEKMRSQEALRHSEETFRGITSAAHNAMIMIDDQGTITFWNEAAVRVFGYSQDEAIEKNIHELVAPPDYLPSVREAFPNFRRNGTGKAIGTTLEMEAVRKSGERFPAEISLSALQSRGKWHAVGIVRDISDRKQAEQTLRDSEMRHRTLFESSSDAVMTMAPPSWKYTCCNRATLKIFGVNDEAEFTLLGPWDLSPEIQPDGRPSSEKAKEMIEIAVRTGSHFFEWTHKRLHGEDFPSTVLLTRMELNGVTMLQATVRDISQQKEIEASLRYKDKQLQHQDKLSAVGGLAGGIAHEFNNLLQAIRGYTKFAMEELSPDGQPHQDLEQALIAADRAAGLTSQLLNFSRHDSLNLEDLQANKVVRELTHMLRPLIGEHIELDSVLDEEAGTIRADANLLGQALMNLCINARDAMPSGGKVTIRTDNLLITETRADIHPDLQPGRYVCFVVADTGCGMPAEVREKIFEPFFTTKEVGKGTGLGLSMVYGVVKQHHGAINVYSEPGNGTTFRIYLPVTEEESIVETTVDVQSDYYGNETILVAEDEQLVRDVAVRILGRAGYTTLAATDGEEAVQMFRDHADDIALVLSDVVMPRLSGYETLQQIRQIRPDVPTVFCTGYDPAASQVSFLAEEGLAIVEKPFGKDSLLKAVREALDRGASFDSAELCHQRCTS